MCFFPPVVYLSFKTTHLLHLFNVFLTFNQHGGEFKIMVTCMLAAIEQQSTIVTFPMENDQFALLSVSSWQFLLIICS